MSQTVHLNQNTPASGKYLKSFRCFNFFPWTMNLQWFGLDDSNKGRNNVCWGGVNIFQHQPATMLKSLA